MRVGCVDGEKETIIMGAAEVTCCFFRRENIHNRPEISEHVHTRVPERSVKHANDNKGQGIRANSAKSEGGNLELTSCTHTQEEKS